MKRTILFLAVLAVPVVLSVAGLARAEDPFAAGADALAVSDSDGSSSLRAKLKLKKMEDDMIMVSVLGVDDSKFPDCVMSAKVLKDPAKKEKHLKLIGRNKTYKFVPELKKKGKGLDLKDQATQSNLGACYYPPKTKLIIKVGNVDLKAKVFKASAIYLKD